MTDRRVRATANDYDNDNSRSLRDDNKRTTNGKSNSNGNCNDNRRSLRDDNKKDKGNFLTAYGSVPRSG